MDCCISPIGFSDHHLIFISVNMEQFPRKPSYWHFNAKLLQDAAFLNILCHSGTIGEKKKMVLKI